MNFYSPLYIKTLFRQYNIKPRKPLGQNFVINKFVIDKIIKAADLKPDDTVLEIGPGIGTLTVELAKKVQKVITVEKDRALCNILQDALQENNLDNVAVIKEDILNFQFLRPKRIPPDSRTNSRCQIQNPKQTYQIKNLRTYKLVANIPYCITQPIIRLFLESENPPQEIILLVQKEVAQRICARPPRMNLLAISVQIYAKPRIIDYVSKNNFWPAPKIDSAIIQITCAGAGPTHKKRFFRIARAGFSSPRKMLINNLTNKLEISKEKLNKIFNKINIDPKARAENLSLADWQMLAKNHDLSTFRFSSL